MYLLPAVFVAAFLFWLLESHNAALLLLQPMPRSLSALVKEGDIPGALFYLVCIWISIKKGICHKKMWSGTSAEGSGLVLSPGRAVQGLILLGICTGIWCRVGLSPFAFTGIPAHTQQSPSSWGSSVFQMWNVHGSSIIIRLGLSYQFWYKIFRGNLFLLNVWAALHTMKPPVSCGSSCNTNKLKW